MSNQLTRLLVSPTPTCVVLSSPNAPEKSEQDQPGVRLASCERSPLGLSHTQNRMSGRPQAAHELHTDPNREPSNAFQLQEMGETGEGSQEPGDASGEIFWMQ